MIRRIISPMSLLNLAKVSRSESIFWSVFEEEEEEGTLF